jgi:rod shape-determining protein MreD
VSATQQTRFALRLGIVGLVGVLIQTAFVSQISVFGVRADLAPLLVGAVGLLCGSMSGAAFGFWVGLLVDTALLQTLGVSSLILTVVGYSAGRLRELRDPANALAPVAVGAAAAATFAVGFSIMQFLLGVEAPVSLLLIREIVLTVAVDAALALPVYNVVRRLVLPFLPDDPRRRRRRAYMTGGLSPISRS